MGNLFDQLGKKIGDRALRPSGATAVQHEIPSNARQADLRHEPDPTRVAERARLGLLGRLASVLCLIEIFSGAPGEEKVLDCIGKLIAFRQQRRLDAKRPERRRGHQEAPRGRRRQAVDTTPTRDDEEAKPAPPLVKPYLWIITAGRPASVLSSLGAVPAEGWPPGVYVSPGEPLDTGDRLAGVPEPGGMLRVGIVVASELPRDRSTILVRLMAGGAALPVALADLAELPADAYERDVASMDVLELRQALGSKPNRTVEEEEFIVSTQNIVEKLRNEARAEEAARAVLTVLRVRGVMVPDAAHERIVAQKDMGRLERWLEKAAFASSVGEVIDEPS
jgi:hypothetical protein